jgi:tetratricopeptide (TPR) repeat protein
MVGDDREDAASQLVTRLMDEPRPRDTLDERRALAKIERELLGGRAQPMRLSRYVLLEQLGAGGGGVVYVAYDPELERKVAIKLLRAGGAAGEASSERASRLAREAQALARISHPNVIAVYDVGTYGEELGGAWAGDTADGPDEGVFVVMELVDGQTLRTWIKTRPRRWREVLEVFLPAGRGLAAAHAAGMTHRDFKPANVLIGRDGRVRVLDFGLARVARTEDISASTGSRPSNPSELAGASLANPLTLSGAVLGTPTYMAPEQHRGETVAEAGDQFSFCVSLYEALYGQRPFTGSTIDELGAAKEKGVGEMPGSPEVPAHLVAALRRGLSVDPQGRFASMNELLAELAFDPIARRRRYLGAALGLALVIGLGSAVTGWARERGRVCDGQESLLAGVWDAEVRQRVEQRFVETDMPYATSVWAATERMLDDYTKRWVDERQSACRLTLVDETQSRAVMDQHYACLDRRLRGLESLIRLFETADAEIVERAPQVLATLRPPEDCSDPRRLPAELTLHREDLTRIDTELSRVDSLRASSLLDEAATAAEALYEETEALDHRGALARVALLRGEIESARGDSKAAERHLFEALTTAESVGESEVAIRAQVQLVTVLTDLAKLEAAERMGKIARAKLEFRGLDDRVDADLAHAMGWFHHNSGHPDEALEAHRQSLEARKRILGEHHVEVGSALNSIGLTYYEKGDFESSLLYLEQSRSVWTSAVGPDHPQVAKVLNNLGITEQARGHFGAAIGHHERALQIRRRSLAPDHPTIVSSLTNLGTVYQAMGDHERGLEYQQQAAKAAEIAHGKDHPMVALALTNTANALAELDRTEEALATHQRAREIYARALPAEHPSHGYPLVNMADTLSKLGRHQEAVAPAREALDIWRRTKGEGHVHTAAARVTLATALEALGKKPEAQALLERALQDLDSQSGVPDILTDAQFLLAKILAQSDRDRAQDLARKALDELAGLDSYAKERTAIRAWLEAN